MLNNDINTVMGMKVVVVEKIPKYQLPLDVPVSPAFRDEFNQWAEQFFGEVDALPNLPIVVNNILFLSKEQYYQLRKENGFLQPLL